MSNVLRREKRQQIEALGRLGWSTRQIEEAIGVRRETISKYLKRAGILVRRRGRWATSKAAIQAITDSVEPKAAIQAITDLGESKAAIKTITDSVSLSVETPRRISACTEHQELIESWLGQGRNGMSIWQELVDYHGFTARYSSVSRFVRKLRESSKSVEHPRIETPPGEEAQVDYGEGPMVRDLSTGKYRRTRLFILTLGHSRQSVRLLCWKSSSRKWCELHERAFRQLGGVPQVVVLDNLREGVIAADAYDPTLNGLYADMLSHYGVVALPARVRDPNRKGKVESAIGHTQRTALAGRRFESIEAAQAHLDHWDKTWAQTRIHGTTKRQVAAMFAEEKPFLKPLPFEPFRYYQSGKRRVHPDGSVEVERAYYSAPAGLIGQTVLAQWDGLRVRLMHSVSGKLLREHLKAPPGHHRRKPEDRPKKTPKNTAQLLARAERAGAHIGTLCSEIHRTYGQGGVRKIMGILSLCKKHGAPTVDDACGAALEFGAPEYRFVKRYLDRIQKRKLSLKQVDPLIRELTQYRDLIESITTERELSDESK